MQGEMKISMRDKNEEKSNDEVVETGLHPIMYIEAIFLISDHFLMLVMCEVFPIILASLNHFTSLFVLA